MKKIISILFLGLILCSSVGFCRTVYNKDNTIKTSNNIRYKKMIAKGAIEQTNGKKQTMAAAAKIKYDDNKSAE